MDSRDGVEGSDVDDLEIDHAEPLWRALCRDAESFSHIHTDTHTQQTTPRIIAAHLPRTHTEPGAWIVASGPVVAVYEGTGADDVPDYVAEARKAAESTPTHTHTRAHSRTLSHTDAGTGAGRVDGDGVPGSAEEAAPARLAELKLPAPVLGLWPIPRAQDERGAWVLAHTHTHMYVLALEVDAEVVLEDAAASPALPATAGVDTSARRRGAVFEIHAQWVAPASAELSEDTHISAREDLRFIAVVGDTDVHTVFRGHADASAATEGDAPVPLHAVCLQHRSPVVSAEWRPRVCVAHAAEAFGGNLRHAVDAAHARRDCGSDDPALLAVLTRDGMVTVWRETDPWEPVAFLACASVSVADPMRPLRMSRLERRAAWGRSNVFIHSLTSWKGLCSERQRMQKDVLRDEMPAAIAWVQRVILHDRLHWAWGKHTSAAETSFPRGANRGTFAPPSPFVIASRGGSSADRNATPAANPAAFPVPTRYTWSPQERTALSSLAEYENSPHGADDATAPDDTSVGAQPQRRWPHDGHWDMRWAQADSLARWLPDPLLSDSPANSNLLHADYFVVLQLDDISGVTYFTPNGSLWLRSAMWRVVGARDVPQRHLAISRHAFSRTSAQSLGLHMDDVRAWFVRTLLEGSATAADHVRPAGGAVPSLVRIDAGEEEEAAFPHLQLQQISAPGGVHSQLLLQDPLTAAVVVDDNVNVADASVDLDEHSSDVHGHRRLASQKDESEDDTAFSSSSGHAITRTSDANGAGTGAQRTRPLRLRTRFASALATAACFDLMDTALAPPLYDGRDSEPGPRQLRRLASRSGKRGCCDTLTSNRAPTAVLLTNGVRRMQWRPNVDTGLVPFAATAGARVAAYQEAGTGTGSPPSSDLPQWHPDAMLALWEAGRPDAVARIFAQLARTLRHRAWWQSAVECARERLQAADDAKSAREVQRRLAAAGIAYNDGVAGTSDDIDAGRARFDLADDAAVCSGVQLAPEDYALPFAPLPISSLLATSPTAITEQRKVSSDAGLGLEFDDAERRTASEAGRARVVPAAVPTMPLRGLLAWLRAHAYDDAEPSSTSSETLPRSMVDPTETARDNEISARGALLDFADMEMLSQQLVDEGLPGLSSSDNLRVFALLEALRTMYSDSASEVAALDQFGARFFRSVKLFQLARRTMRPGDRPASLLPIDCAWAIMSESQDLLLRLCLPAVVALQAVWQDVKLLLVPLWLREDAALREVMERVAKSQYLRADKDPWAACLPYLALGLQKLPVLRGLFKLSNEHQRIHTFLSNDFRDARWQLAAVKNAYALLGQHRYEHAAAFFLLAGRLTSALKIILSEMHDTMLALMIARLWVANAAANTAASAVGEALEKRDLIAKSTGTLLPVVGASMLLKDVAAALIELQKQRRAMPSTASMSMGGDGTAPRAVPRSDRPKARSILGDDFDEDIPVAAAREVPTAERAATSEDPPQNPHLASISWKPATRSEEVACDADPVRHVVQYWVLDNKTGAHEPAGNGAPSGDAAAAFLLLWYSGRALDALSTVCVAAADGDGQAALLVRCIMRAPAYRRPPIWKVLSIRAVSVALRMPVLSPSVLALLDTETAASEALESLTATAIGLQWGQAGAVAAVIALLQPVTMASPAFAPPRTPTSGSLVHATELREHQRTVRSNALAAAVGGSIRLAQERAAGAIDLVAEDIRRHSLEVDLHLHPASVPAAHGAAVDALRKGVCVAIADFIADMLFLRTIDDGCSECWDGPAGPYPSVLKIRQHGAWLLAQVLCTIGIPGAAHGPFTFPALLSEALHDSHVVLRQCLEDLSVQPVLTSTQQLTHALKPELQVRSSRNSALFRRMVIVDVITSTGPSAELISHAWAHLAINSMAQRRWGDVLSLLAVHTPCAHGPSWMPTFLLYSNFAHGGEPRAPTRKGKPAQTAPWDAWAAIMFRNIALACLCSLTAERLSVSALAPEGSALAGRLRATAGVLLAHVASGRWVVQRDAGAQNTKIEVASGSHPLLEGMCGAVSADSVGIARSSTAWWQDMDRFADSWFACDTTGVRINAVKEQFRALSSWLGLSGLLWLIGTERRAMARALNRAHGGFLPDVKQTSRTEVRARCGSPALGICLLPGPGRLLGARDERVQSETKAVDERGLAQLVLLSTREGRGVMHAALEANGLATTNQTSLRANGQARDTRTLIAEAASGVIASAVSRLRHVASSSSISSMHGRDGTEGDIASTLATAAQRPSSRSKEPAAIQALRGASDTALPSASPRSIDRTAASAEPMASALAGAPCAPAGASSHIHHSSSGRLVSKLKGWSAAHLGGWKRPQVTGDGGPGTAAARADTTAPPNVSKSVTASTGGTDIWRRLQVPMNLGHRRVDSAAALPPTEAAAAMHKPSPLRPRADDQHGRAGTGRTGHDAPAVSSSEGLLTAASGPASGPPAAHDDIRMQPLSIQTMSDLDSHVPTEASATASPDVESLRRSAPSRITILPDGRYELPTSLTGTAHQIAQHPSAPLYVRAGPGGALSICSVTFEPVHGAPAPPAADGSGPSTVLECVHRLQTGLAYTPLPGAPLPVSTHAYPSLASAMGGGGGGSSLSSALATASLTTPGARDDSSARHAARLSNAVDEKHSATPTPAPVLGPDFLDYSQLDASITRVRWSADGRHVLACFASGVVRRWDVGIPDAPDHTLSTSGSHRLDVSVHESAQRAVWAATDVAPLTLSSCVMAVTAAPLWAPASTPTHAKSPHSMMHGPETAARRSSRVQLPPSTSSTSSAWSELLRVGWGLHVFDVRASDAAVITALEQPGCAGCTSVFFDEQALSLLVGAEDGSVLLYDLRTQKPAFRIPGVPLVASHSARSSRASASTQAGLDARHEPTDAIPVRDVFAHAGAISHIVSHPSHRLVATGGQDGDVKLWSLPDLAHVSTIARAHAPRPIVPFASEAELASTWVEQHGVSGLVLTEDAVVSCGFDGAVVFFPQQW